MFTKEMLNSCKLSYDEWVKPLSELNKDCVYVVGYFDSHVVYYKAGMFYISGDTDGRHYNFSNLQRAYAYFEQVFYGRKNM